MKSIFERIDEVVKENGCVPADFELEDVLKPGEQACKYMGEQEGLIGRPVKPAPKEVLKRAVKIIQESIKINAKLAVHSFDDNDLGFRVADIRGQLLKNIIDNIKEYDPHKLSTLAYSLVIFGTKLETVKLGLLLLVLFNFDDDEVVKKHLITLGLYEEFTSYVISNVKSWPIETREHVYYVYAQKLTGWGKINAMECLEAVNDEVREWVLRHGCRNDISYGFLGKAAYDKSDFARRLSEGKFNEEQMQGARDIMRGLLDEEQVKGISLIKEPVKLAMLYLKELSGHTVDLDDIANMYELKSYILDKDGSSSEEDKKKLVDMIDRLTSLSDTDNMLREGLKDRTAVALWAARQAGIDISDELLECVRYDFEKYYGYADYFLEEDLRVDEFLNLCVKNLSGRDFKEGMGTEPAPPDSESIWQLDTVLGCMGMHPGKGEKIVTTAVNSSIIRYRFAAAKLIREWEEENGRNIKKISSDVFRCVKKLKKKEVDEDLKKAWEEILNFK